jgi:hypothetical protein
MPNYEVFTRKIPRMGTPMMSFSKLGQITFNQSAARILQKETVEYVLLLWASEDRTMAMKTTSNKKDPRAYHIRFHEKGNGAAFSAKTFLDYIEADYSERKGVPVEINPDREMFLEVKLPDSIFKRKTTQPKIVERGARMG